MSWLSEALHDGGRGRNPADAAMPYLEQIPGTVKPYLEPYSQQGQESSQLLADSLKGLLSDPSGFINQIMEGYEPSAGYQARKKEMLGQAGNTAAAGGFRGTDSDVRNQLGITDELMSKDQQDWLKNVLGVFGTGLQGEGSLMQGGLNASESLASTLANMLGSEATAQFRGSEAQEQRHNDLMKSILSLGAQGLGGAASSAGEVGMDMLPNTMPAAGGMFF